MTDADKFAKGEKVPLANGNTVWWDRGLQAIVREQFDETRNDNVLVIVYRVSEEKARAYSVGLERATA
jgi:hypothetical protein